VLLIFFFMIKAHPFQQVYFNELVSHDKEALRKNYELDYWGCSYKQGLEKLIKENPTGTIKVFTPFPTLVSNNLILLNEAGRKRIQLTEREHASYFITNFRNHPYDYPLSNTDYSIQVQNSTILCIYKNDTNASSSAQAMTEEIAALNNNTANHPDNLFLQAEVGDAYFWNGFYDSAYYHHNRALQIRPNSLAINDLAGEYFMKGKYALAIDFCKKGIKLTPNDINAYINTGLCYMRLAKYDSAITYLTHAIQIDAESVNANQNLAYAYQIMGNTEQAKKYEAIARKTTPEFKLN